MDRQALIDNVLNGYGTPAYSVCDSSPWKPDDMKVENRRRGCLLDEAGWAFGRRRHSFERRRSCGVRCITRRTTLFVRALAAEFADQMKELGIEVTPRGQAGTTSIPTSLPRPFCGAGGLMRRRSFLRAHLFEGLGQHACWARQRRNRTVIGRSARCSLYRRFLRTVPEGAVGRNAGVALRARLRVWLCQRGPSVFQARPRGPRAEASSARAWLEPGEQRRPVELGVAIARASRERRKGTIATPMLKFIARHIVKFRAAHACR